MGKLFSRRAAASALGLTLFFCWAKAVPAAEPSVPTDAATNQIVLPASVPDTFEPFNRAMWDVNRVLVLDIVQPTGRAYRWVVRPPARRAVSNFGRNLQSPQRIFNNLLQARWLGAGWETERFLCNSFLGLAGLFDVAGHWGVPKSNADFGQTFGVWGWRPDFYLMLPFFGPSNDRDAVGLAAQAAANPVTYFTPYAYVPYFVDYNNLASEAEPAALFIQSEMDPYALTQYAWTFVRKNEVANFHVTGKIDRPSLETLQYVYFTYDDPEFPSRAKTGCAFIAATGRRLPFTYWLQPGRAPVVYIVPGLGSHRLSDSSIALAELVYKNGFSAVSISSPFNAEFMNNAGTAYDPGYTPVDGGDLRVALTEVDRALSRRFPGRLASRGLMGYSMGAYETLFLAATEANQPDAIHFNRYVAINTPVTLARSAKVLDDFYKAPLAWPAETRVARINNTFLKVAALSRMSMRPSLTLPFDAVESRFLIGLTFRFILRDIIYDSQRRHNQGLLQLPIDPWRRRFLYDEIMRYSYADYLDDFVIPSYQAHGTTKADAQAFAQADDLRTYAAGLQANRQIRVVGTEDDFLLSPDDLSWLRATFGPSQLTLFPRGGHLGNLSNANVQRAILTALENLRPVPQSKRVLARPSAPSSSSGALPALP